MLLRQRSACRRPSGASPHLQVLAVLCLAVLGSALASSTASGASIAQKRKEAARLQAAIDATTTKIEVLNEDYLDAQIRLKKFSTKAATSSAAAAQTEKALTALRARIRSQALSSFARPAASQGDALRTAEDLNQLERRGAYANQASVSNFDAEDELRAALATLKERRSAAAEASAAVAAEVRILADKQVRASTLLKEYSVLSSRAQGDLAVLVREAEQAAAEREAAQARADQRKRQEKALAELERRRADTRKRLAQGTNSGVGGAARGNVPQVSILRRNRSETAVVPNPDPGSETDTQLAIDAGVTAEVAASPGAGSAVRLALAQVGKPYVWAADGPSSFDCSGLMLFAWRAAGANLPHSSRSQYSSTSRVGVSQIRPGDLIFYGHPIHHVGMYVGNGKMVEASHAGAPVRISSIFRRDMVGVGRVG